MWKQWPAAAALLAALSLHAGCSIAEDQPPAKTAAPSVNAESRARDAIMQALAKPFGLTFDNKPLDEALSQMAGELGIPIVLDHKGLEEADVSASSAVRFSAAGVTTKSALNLILRPLELDYEIRDEVLWVSTPDKVGAILEVRIYDVTGIVEDSADEVDWDSLIDIIHSLVAPSSWEDSGGPGWMIQPYKHNAIRALVISQTFHVHEEITSLLTQLREFNQRAKHDRAAASAKNEPHRSHISHTGD